MIRGLRTLQNPAMYDASKTLMAAWTLLCAFGLVAVLINGLNMASAAVVQRAVVEFMAVAFWLTIWTYVTAGLAIMAFVTKPRETVVQI